MPKKKPVLGIMLEFKKPAISTLNGIPKIRVAAYTIICYGIPSATFHTNAKTRKALKEVLDYHGKSDTLPEKLHMIMGELVGPLFPQKKYMEWVWHHPFSMKRVLGFPFLTRKGIASELEYKFSKK